MRDRTTDTAMIAVQGPRALETLQPLFNQPLESVRYYHLTMGRLMDRVDTVVSRTGYTGEDGFEVIVGAKAAPEIWEALLESGSRMGSSRAASGPATRSDSRPRCRCMATSWARTRTRSRRAWDGR